MILSKVGKGLQGNRKVPTVKSVTLYRRIAYPLQENRIAVIPFGKKKRRMSELAVVGAESEVDGIICSMKKHLTILAFGIIASGAALDARVLPVSEYKEKMIAGWIGQIAGVVWGWPTEFKYCGVIAPDSALREWDPFMINEGFDQDDLYVEMTFLETLSKDGLRVDIRQAGVDFANSQYRLWCANRVGRTNLRRGIAPPDCSHPKFNKCPTDIDYQIEADYSGLISPGCPQMVVDLGNKFGRLMNYGDGVYGGQFIGGMYAEAFFETDRVKIVEAALACIPSKSLYAEMVRDMLKWYETDPNDWKFAWKCAKAKWRDYPEYQKASNGDIDVKINGAMVLLGFLWGGGDPEKTIRISARGGYDSDCNPSSAAGVLFASLGLRKIPKEYYSALDRARKFSFTAYDFPALVEVSEKLARQIVVASGGKIRKDKSGKEVFVIPQNMPSPGEYDMAWSPSPPEGSRYSPEEMATIRFNADGKPKIK